MRFFLPFFFGLVCATLNILCLDCNHAWIASSKLMRNIKRHSLQAMILIDVCRSLGVLCTTSNSSCRYCLAQHNGLWRIPFQSLRSSKKFANLPSTMLATGGSDCTFMKDYVFHSMKPRTSSLLALPNTFEWFHLSSGLMISVIRTILGITVVESFRTGLVLNFRYTLSEWYEEWFSKYHTIRFCIDIP